MEASTSLRASCLDPGGQGIDVDTGSGELRQHGLAVAPVGRQQRGEFAVRGKG
jgi:hypothetical protein